jgi:hypothetical protein
LPKGKLKQDDVRFYEIETATKYSIPFDERWYSIPVLAREQMVAANIARVTISNLAVEDARKKIGDKQTG